MKARWNTLWTVAQRELLVQIQSATFWIMWLTVSVLLCFLFLISWVLLQSVQALSTATNIVDFQDEIKRTLSSPFDLYSHADSALVYYVVDHSDGFSDRIRVAIWENWDVSTWNFNSLDEFDVKEFLVSPDEDAKLKYAAQSIHSFRELQEPLVSVSTLNTWLEQGKIDGYFVLPENIQDEPRDARFVTRLTELVPRDHKLMEMKAWYEDLTKSALQSVELEKAGVVEPDRARILQNIQVSIEKVLPESIVAPLPRSRSQSQDTSTVLIDFDRFFSIGYVVLFGILLLFASKLFLTNIVEEKSSKLSEVLSSTVDPIQLLDGKLLGHILVIGSALAVVCVFVLPPLILFLMGMPSTGTNSHLELLHPLRVLHWCLFLLFALCFYGYIITALGSLCQDLKEVGMTMYPVNFFVTFGVIPVTVIALFNPQSTLTQVLTFYPTVHAICNDSSF